MTARRVASLLPSATETLFAIGAGDLVVGVTHECDLPFEATRRPTLTSTRIEASARADESLAAAIDRQVNEFLSAGRSLYDLDVAQLTMLAPDLIVTQALCDVCAVAYPLVERVARELPSHPRILSLEPATLADVIAAVLTLGAATAREDGARRLVARITTRIDDVRRAVSGARRKRTLLLEWTDPPFGGGHWAADLIARAGGEPVCVFPGEPSAAITWKAIEANDPEIIIVGPCGTDLAGTLAALTDLERTRPSWRAFASQRRVVALDGQHYVNRPGPSFAPTVELFAAAIHPERVARPPASAFREMSAFAPT